MVMSQMFGYYDYHKTIAKNIFNSCVVTVYYVQY